MFKSFSRVGLITAISTLAIANPLAAQVSPYRGSSRPPTPPIDQQTVITGNGNTVQQNVNLYYVDPRGRVFPYSSAPSSTNLQQAVSPSIIRTPVNLPNPSYQNFPRY